VRSPVPVSRGERNKSVGAYGERVAAQRLVEDGMVLVDRNWRCDAGEIDLVLRDGDVLVFCEVKTRTDTSHGHPLEAVGPAKAARLRRLAGKWLDAHDLRARGVRIDLVGVLLAERGAAEVSHVRGVG
jgi:putative endonuclease